MLVERAELQIREGMEREFSVSMENKGLALLESVPGVNSVQLRTRRRESAEVHAARRRGTRWPRTSRSQSSPAMTEFRALLKPFSTGGAMEHFNMN